MSRAALKLLVFGLMVGAGLASAADEPRLLMWEQMIPASELEQPPVLPGAEPEKVAPNELAIGGWTYGTEPVAALDGQLVKLPGFVVPLESDEGGLLNEFLLVPYAGACIHLPPPPPNQIVYVTLEEPYELTSMWDPFWITGTMHTEPYLGEIAQTVYRMSAIEIEDYDY